MYFLLYFVNPLQNAIRNTSKILNIQKLDIRIKEKKKKKNRKKIPKVNIIIVEGPKCKGFPKLSAGATPGLM